MFEHDESNLKELEDRPRCCPINYQDSSNMPESEITVLQRNTTIRKRFRIFIGNAGSIQMYLEPEDTPYSKISDLTLYEIELHQDRDLDVPPHLRDAYSVEQNKIEDFEPGEVIEISGCSCGYEVQGHIEIFVPDSVAPNKSPVKMVVDTGIDSKQEFPFLLSII